MKRMLSLLMGVAVLFFLSSTFNSNVSAAELLTQKEKVQYYHEYLDIADELREENPNAIDFTVVAFKDFKETDWVEPEKFREKLTNIIDGGITFVAEEITQQGFSTFSSGAGPTPTKYVNAYSSAGTFLGQIVVIATVSTKWDSGIQGQVISGISNVSSYTMQSLSYWNQTSATGSKVTLQSWNLKLIGNFTTGGVTFPQAFTINYKTTSGGTIS